MIEIERKFLLKNTDFKKEAFNKTRIIQSDGTIGTPTVRAFFFL